MPKKKPAVVGTCTVTPDEVKRFADVVVSASGWQPYNTISVVVHGGAGEGPAVTGMNIDADGNGSLVYHTVWLGTNVVTLNGVATDTFEVEP